MGSCPKHAIFRDAALKIVVSLLKIMGSFALTPLPPPPPGQRGEGLPTI